MQKVNNYKNKSKHSKYNNNNESITCENKKSTIWKITQNFTNNYELKTSKKQKAKKGTIFGKIKK